MIYKAATNEELVLAELQSQVQAQVKTDSNPPPPNRDLIVKEQFINACSEELAVYLLERRLKDLVELTTWTQQYLIVLNKVNQHSLYKVRHKDARGHYSAMVLCQGFMATDNQNVRPKSVPAEVLDTCLLE